MDTVRRNARRIAVYVSNQLREYKIGEQLGILSDGLVVGDKY